MIETINTILVNMLKNSSLGLLIMAVTTIIEVFDECGNLTSKFERTCIDGDVCWTQYYQNEAMKYNERTVDNSNVQLYDNKALISLCYEPCTMYMHIDAGKRVRMFPQCTLKLTYVVQDDDNDEIMKLLKDRLSLGKQRYGHGVRIDDDTRQWGTDTDSWETMMMEEALDGMIYAAAQLLRIKKRRTLTKG